jgi:uncharacterized protein
MNHVVCHFEIPVNEFEKMQNFYGKLFGWKFESMPGMGDYVLINTGAEPGGGMMKKPVPEAKPVNYINVEDVAEYVERIKALGGNVVFPRSPIPGMGWFAIGVDPEGNPIGLFQDDKRAK